MCFILSLAVFFVCMCCGCNDSVDGETESYDIACSDTESSNQYDSDKDVTYSDEDNSGKSSECEASSVIIKNDETETQAVMPDNVNTNITDNDALKILCRIGNVANEYGVAVAYKYNNYYYRINGSVNYASASTIKAVYCQYLLASGADFNEEIVFDTDDVRSSTSGKLTDEHKGEVFTVGELVGYTLRYSDNMAYRLLFNKYGRQGFNAYVKELGIPGLAFGTDHEFTQVTAAELSDGMWEILEYSSKDKILTDHLINADYKYQIASGTKYTVASKYGNQGGTKGYHDTAIVYAPEPYVLTIMSNLDVRNNPDANKPFARITGLTDSLHKILCEA